MFSLSFRFCDTRIRRMSCSVFVLCALSCYEVLDPTLLATTSSPRKIISPYFYILPTPRSANTSPGLTRYHILLSDDPVRTLWLNCDPIPGKLQPRSYKEDWLRSRVARDKHHHGQCDKKGGGSQRREMEAAECPFSGGFRWNRMPEISHRFQLPAGLKLVVLVSRYPIR